MCNEGENVEEKVRASVMKEKEAIRILMLIFFFQAEDGIRDHCVTEVQTCALPI